jgi:hypothetical protein
MVDENVTKQKIDESDDEIDVEQYDEQNELMLVLLLSMVVVVLVVVTFV